MARDASLALGLVTCVDRETVGRQIDAFLTVVKRDFCAVTVRARVEVARH